MSFIFIAISITKKSKAKKALFLILTFVRKKIGLLPVYIRAEAGPGPHEKPLPHKNDEAPQH
jgi:hypothetical protein